MNVSIPIDLNPLLLIPFFAQVVLNLLVINVWNNQALKKFHGVYQAEQKIHEGFVPRFGGFVMLVVFVMMYLFEFFFEAHVNEFSILIFLNHFFLICCLFFRAL